MPVTEGEMGGERGDSRLWGSCAWRSRLGGWGGGWHLQLGPLSLLGIVEGLLEAWHQLLIGITGLLSGQSDVQPGLGILGHKVGRKSQWLPRTAPSRHSATGSLDDGSPGVEMPTMPTSEWRSHGDKHRDTLCMRAGLMPSPHLQGVAVT